MSQQAAVLPSCDALGEEIMSHTAALAACSEGSNGVTRRFATPEHRAASDLILGWMQDAGMQAWVDDSGNTVGRYEGEQPGLPALLFGSHQDTVRNGGRYDGMLGIITPIACVKSLHERGERLPFAIEIIAFGDEEGVRFQTTLLGSRAIAGTFDHSVLDRVDEEGISMREAMRNFDLDPQAIASIARRPEQVLAFIEIHIEQGPVLEAEGLSVGVVTAIAGGVRLQVSVTGVAGHAGTVPMEQRRDALTAAAECILAIEKRCSGQESLVGTVGKIAAEPGAINVIPGAVVFSADIRAADDAIRDAAVNDVTREIIAIGKRRGMDVRIEETYKAKGCACAPWLMDQLEAAVIEEGVSPRRLFSGAGHDAMAMVDLTDVAMLFVRCEKGISHNPAEAITAADAGTGARVLLRFMRNFSLS